MHDANGQRQQRKLLPHPLAIRRNKTSSLKVFGAVETSTLALEVIKQLIESFAPILGAEDEQEVVAADVTDEVARGVYAFVEALRQTQQNFITPSVAVDIVKGFETVDVDVANHRLPLLLQQSRQALLDRHLSLIHI